MATFAASRPGKSFAGIERHLAMEIPATGKINLRTNLADYPVTMAMKDGRVASPLVSLDFCGPPVAHDGFKAMFRENAF